MHVHGNHRKPETNGHGHDNDADCRGHDNDRKPKSKTHRIGIEEISHVSDEQCVKDEKQKYT